MAIAQDTPISVIDKYAATTPAIAFPDMCFGADFDDAWLWQEGFARISTPADYAVNPLTQILAEIPPTLNQVTHLWDVFEVAVVPLLTAAEAKCNLVDAILATKIAAGAHWNGTLFQIDAEKSQPKFAGAGAWAMGVVSGVTGARPWPNTFAWIAADNTLIAMTAAQCYDFTQAMGAAVTALTLTGRAIKNNCLAASTLAALNAIDITQNWPTV